MEPEVAGGYRPEQCASRVLLVCSRATIYTPTIPTAIATTTIPTTIAAAVATTTIPTTIAAAAVSASAVAPAPVAFLASRHVPSAD